ncbi:MAG: IS200/IS605 family transposase [Acidobacteria bacterium]|nr:IS200/IS605 family transposase [Acidobacteriota bacterium]
MRRLLRSSLPLYVLACIDYHTAMHLEPLTQLNWAYRLHYYLCWQTHRYRALFTDNSKHRALAETLQEICQRHDYHLLHFKIYPDHVRCLLSLRPAHIIATVIQKLKANSAREFRIQFPDVSLPLWARGYFARSVGQVRIEAVRRYLDQQAEHHGYSNRTLPPAYRYKATQPVRLEAAHANFDLIHHLVFATRYREGIFGSSSGKALTEYWLRVAAKKGFAIDQISIVPDHVHMLVRLAPTMSVEMCGLWLLNNGQYFMGKEFGNLLVRAKVPALWQPSGYAGTCGTVTTALVKQFLNAEKVRS